MWSTPRVPLVFPSSTSSDIPPSPCSLLCALHSLLLIHGQYGWHTGRLLLSRNMVDRMPWGTVEEAREVPEAKTEAVPPTPLSRFCSLDFSWIWFHASCVKYLHSISKACLFIHVRCWKIATEPSLVEGYMESSEYPENGYGLWPCFQAFLDVVVYNRYQVIVFKLVCPKSFWKELFCWYLTCACWLLFMFFWIQTILLGSLLSLLQLCIKALKLLVYSIRLYSALSFKVFKSQVL